MVNFFSKKIFRLSRHITSTGNAVTTAPCIRQELLKVSMSRLILELTDVQVASGTAIDEDGHMIVLENGSDPLTIRPEHHGKTVLLVISYDDEPSDPATVGGNGKTRMHEKPKLEFFVEDAIPSQALGRTFAWRGWKLPQEAQSVPITLTYGSAPVCALGTN